MKVSIIFTTLYGIYWVFFRKHTFHNLNRLLLLLILVSSVTIPVMEFNSTDYFVANNIDLFELGTFDEMVGLQYISTTNTTENTFDFWNILTYVYLLGVVFFLMKSVSQLAKIVGILIQNKKINLGENKIVITPNNLPPFSFLNWIFLPEDEYSNAEINPIIEHESIHAKQLHTIDLLLTELFCIYLWFVPFVYSFKNSIKSVHEYLADKKVIKDTQTTVDYLKLLAANTEKYTLIGLSNNFYCSTLKNRITMMTKNRSSKLARIKYLLLLPAFVLLIQSFSSINNNKFQVSNELNEIDKKPEVEKKPSFIEPIAKSDCEISANYGMFTDPLSKKERMHKAIDLKAETGTTIKASANGKVVKLESSAKGYGNVIVIKHSNGYSTLYSHLSEFKVAFGDIVNQGDIIGLVGNTGRSTGSHLHFEIRKDGNNVNPADYITFK